MTYILRLFYGRHLIEDILTEDTITRIGIDGEITYAKARQILEEVRALGWIHMIVLQSCLDDDARS